MTTKIAPKKKVLKTSKNTTAPQVTVLIQSAAEIAEEKYVDEMGQRLLDALNRGSQIASEENERLGLVLGRG